MSWSVSATANRAQTTSRRLGKPRCAADDAIDLTFLEGQIEAELIDLNVIREWERNPMGYAGLAGQRGRSA